MRFWKCPSTGFSGAGKHAVSAVLSNASPWPWTVCVRTGQAAARRVMDESHTHSGRLPGLRAAREQGRSTTAPL